MNYFELYQLPVSFNPDVALVKKQFYALSKKYHPDFYINESQEKQDEVLELSTLNNKAFQILKDPNKVLEYVLALKGSLVEGENYALPQSFLMEMMDVNELVMDLQFEPNKEAAEKVKAEITVIEEQLLSELAQLTKAFDEGVDEEKDTLLLKIKDLFYRNKYVLRLKESVAKL